MITSSTSGPATPDGSALVPCTFRAKALRGQDLLADSSAALLEQPADAAPRLHFPTADVSDPPDGTSQSPRGYVSFSGEDVRFELVDPMEGNDPRDVTTKRFPAWGDIDDLIDVMDLRPTGQADYTSVFHSDERRPVVEGSQMLGQAMLAASRRAEGRRVTSAHMIFLRGADSRRALDFHLHELSSGRTFTNLTVSVGQDGRERAAGILQLDVTAPDVIRHAAPPPPCAGPYDSPPLDMAVTGRDIRVVDGAYTDDSAAPVGPPVIDAWVRFRTLPPEPSLHAALLAQFAGHMPIAAALRPHPGIGQERAHRTLSTAINAITLSIHSEVRADRWMRYHHLSTFAGAGMTHAECRVYNDNDDLLASFTVDAMVREFGDPTLPVDPQTSM